MVEYIERARVDDFLVDMETLALYEDSIPAIKKTQGVCLTPSQPLMLYPWEWLERYASGMRMNYASSWVYEARKEYEGG